MGADCSSCHKDDLVREATGDIPAGKMIGVEVLNADHEVQTDFEVSFVTSMKVLEEKKASLKDSDAEDTEAQAADFEAEEKAKHEAEEKAKQQEEEAKAKRLAAEEEQKRSFLLAMQEAKKQQEAEEKARKSREEQAAKEAAVREAARKAAQEEAELLAAEEKARAGRHVKELIAQGEHAIKKRDLDAAIGIYTKVIELEGEKHHGWAGRGKARMLQLFTNEAMKDLDQAIKRDSTLMDTRLDRAQCKMSLENLEGGLKDINEVLKLAPMHGQALWMRGQVKERKGDKKAAQQDYNLARRVGYRP